MALAEELLEITVLPQDARSTNSDHCHFSLKATAGHYCYCPAVLPACEPGWTSAQ
jgi:hypothetical protein